MSRPKEVRYFLDTIDYKPNNPNYEKGWNWYQNAFVHYNGEAAVGEATPNYSARTRSPNTANRIYEFNPNMKLIYMVRNPLERQISAWKMQYAFGQGEVLPSVQENSWALKGIDYWMQKNRDRGQWNDCRYGYQIGAYKAFFPEENICISFLEDWKHSKVSEVNRILRFLNLDLSLLPKDVKENKNRNADRKISRPFVDKLRANQTARTFFNALPASWRDWSQGLFAAKEMTYPTTEMSQTIRDSFVAYIGDDIQMFLAQCGKPDNFWSDAFASRKQEEVDSQNIGR